MSVPTQCREVGDCHLLPEQGNVLGCGSNESSYFKRLEIQVVLRGASTNAIWTLQELQTHADGGPGEQVNRFETLDIDFALQTAFPLAPVAFGDPKYGACDVLEETVVRPVLGVLSGIKTCR